MPTATPARTRERASRTREGLRCRIRLADGRVFAGELAAGVAAWRATGGAVHTIPLVRPDQVEATVLDVRHGSEYAAGHLPDALRRAGDGALTSTVRGGPIGVNRIDLPTTHILLAGRGTREADPQRLREAVVDHHRPATAIGNLRRLAGDQTVAVVVQPRPDHARDAMTAARLARQDQASGSGTRQAPPLALPARAHRASPAAASAAAPTR